MNRTVFVTVWWVAGCVEDVPAPLEPAPLAEVCGESGPVRLLALEPDLRVAFFGAPAAVEGRLLFVAGKVKVYSAAGNPILKETRVYAVGPCGEDPVVVGEGIESVFVEPSYAGVAFGCTEDRALVRLDPTGAAPPRLLARGVCSPYFTPHGLLRYDIVDGDSTVEFHPLLDAEGPTFGPPIRVAEPVPTVNALVNSVRILRDEVLMVEDGELARYGLPELERSVLAYDVVVFDVSDDGRFLFYQGPGSGGDQYNPVGPIYALDRERAVSGPIGSGVLTLADFIAPDVLRVDVVAETEHQRLVSLPNYGFIEVPAGHDVVARLGDGRWLTTTDYLGPWHVFDAAKGTTSLVSERRGRRRGPMAEHLDLVLSTAQNPQETGAWVRYFYDGRAPRTLAERANRDAIEMDDGRILTMVEVDDEWLGGLTMVDPSSTKGLGIDERVTVAWNLVEWMHPTEAGAVMYGVVDGERSGVWVARPE